MSARTDALRKRMQQEKVRQAYTLVRHPRELTDDELGAALDSHVRVWLDTPLWQFKKRLGARVVARWMRRIQRERERVSMLAKLRGEGGPRS